MGFMWAVGNQRRAWPKKAAQDLHKPRAALLGLVFTMKHRLRKQGQITALLRKFTVTALLGHLREDHPV